MLEESYFVEILNITSPYCCVDATVYVGGLDDKVSEAILWELFLQAGPVGELSVRSRSMPEWKGYLPHCWLLDISFYSVATVLTHLTC